MFFCLIVFISWDIEQCVHTVACFSDCDTINVKINLIFLNLIFPFFCRIKKTREKFNYLENKNIFWWEENNFELFLNDCDLSNICVRSQSMSLKTYVLTSTKDLCIHSKSEPDISSIWNTYKKPNLGNGAKDVILCKNPDQNTCNQ